MSVIDDLKEKKRKFRVKRKWQNSDLKLFIDSIKAAIEAIIKQ